MLSLLAFELVSERNTQSDLCASLYMFSWHKIQSYKLYYATIQIGVILDLVIMPLASVFKSSSIGWALMKGKGGTDICSCRRISV